MTDKEKRIDDFYIQMVCQASKWLDEKTQGLTGDEKGVKHTYLDRVDCAKALVIANDKLQEQAQNYNKLWAHSSELQAEVQILKENLNASEKFANNLSQEKDELLECLKGFVSCTEGDSIDTFELETRIIQAEQLLNKYSNQSSSEFGYDDCEINNNLTTSEGE